MKSKGLVFLGTLFVLLSIGLPTLSSRHLWSDEVETADRARIILERGLPKLVGTDERISVNAAGKEIEDSDLHRYTPWVQFYVGALGLKVGSFFDWNSDFSIRWPFFFLHALTAAMLATFIVPGGIFLKLAFGLFYGLSSIEFLHARTARYHSILAFLIVLYFLWNKKRGPWSAALFPVLVHTHTLAGSAVSALLFLKNQILGSASKSKQIVSFLILGLSALSVLLLTRPWVQSAWGSFSRPELRSLKDQMLSPWVLLFLSAGFFCYKYERSKNLLWLFFGFVGLVSFLDGHAFSQARYYIWISVIVICVFSEWNFKTQFLQKNKTLLLLGFIFIREFMPPIERPFQSVRLVWAEGKHPDFRKEQAVEKMLQKIKTEDPEGLRPVLFEYVPQFVTWYLKNPVAMMPEPSTQRSISANNPLFKKTLGAYYHLWYANYQQNWACHPQCNFIVEKQDNLIPGGVYYLKSDQKRERFCIEEVVKTNQWNNSPFMNFTATAHGPNSDETNQLVFGRLCE